MQTNWSKNFFYKMFIIITKYYKIDYQNRKCNYQNKLGLIWAKLSTASASYPLAQRGKAQASFF